MASLTQIASALQVSATTVSKAINYKPGVSADKAEMIRQYAKRLGYRPAYMAKSLISGNTKMIGVMFERKPNLTLVCGFTASHSAQIS